MKISNRRNLSLSEALRLSDTAVCIGEGVTVTVHRLPAPVRGANFKVLRHITDPTMFQDDDPVAATYLATFWEVGKLVSQCPVKLPKGRWHSMGEPVQSSVVLPLPSPRLSWWEQAINRIFGNRLRPIGA